MLAISLKHVGHMLAQWQQPDQSSLPLQSKILRRDVHPPFPPFSAKSLLFKSCFFSLQKDSCTTAGQHYLNLMGRISILLFAWHITSTNFSMISLSSFVVCVIWTTISKEKFVCSFSHLSFLDALLSQGHLLESLLVWYPRGFSKLSLSFEVP